MLNATGDSNLGKYPGLSSIGIGVPTLIAFFVAQKSLIYNVPPKHLPLSAGIQARRPGQRFRKAGVFTGLSNPQGAA